MKKMMLAGALLAVLSVSAVGGQMYEWRDPTTGRLVLGDKPPSGVQYYWKEGELRPEEKALQAKKAAEAKAEQDRIDAVRKAEEEKRNIAIEIENEKERKAYQAMRDKKCTGNPEDSGIRIGMDVDTFKFCFGSYPEKINTTKTSIGTKEQWVYRFASESQYYYFTNGILTAIQK